MSNIIHTLAQHTKPTSLYALEQSILGWAHERNLIKGSACRKQLAKTCEEFGELAAGLNKCKHDLIKDGVGDVLVTLIIANGCAGGEHLFSSDPTHNNWLITTESMLEIEPSELVLKLLYELEYITRPHTVWRAARLHDLVRLLTASAHHVECSLTECLLTAWLEIKDRKGRMVDGVFVKEADLPPVVYGSGESVAPDHNC